MDCEHFDKVTLELLYDELDELSAAATLRHLHHCTRCRDIWDHLRTTCDMAEVPLIDPPEGLFEEILQAERHAHRSLPIKERASRAISVLAGYAMRPQVTMAAILLLMIGSSLVFIRTGPSGTGQVRVTEQGTPQTELSNSTLTSPKLVFGSDERRMLGKEESAAGALAVAQKRTGGTREATTETQHTYAEAMKAYQAGRYAAAERLFSEAASEGGARAASAALHEGHAARNGSGCQRAAPLYDSVATRYVGRSIADEASWHAASCYQAMGDTARASSHYSGLQNRPAYSQRATQALTTLARAQPSHSPQASSDSPAAAPPLVAAGPSQREAEAEVDARGDSSKASAAAPSTPPLSDQEKSRQQPTSKPITAPQLSPPTSRGGPKPN